MDPLIRWLIESWIHSFIDSFIQGWIDNSIDYSRWVNNGKHTLCVHDKQPGPVKHRDRTGVQATVVSTQGRWVFMNLSRDYLRWVVMAICTLSDWEHPSCAPLTYGPPSSAHEAPGHLHTPRLDIGQGWSSAALLHLGIQQLGSGLQCLASPQVPPEACVAPDSPWGPLGCNRFMSCSCVLCPQKKVGPKRICFKGSC